MTTTIPHPDNVEPAIFTQDDLGWLPWLEPFPANQLTDRHWAGLVDASRSKSDYFMLLARDPDILQFRTKTDKDIFYNTRIRPAARRARVIRRRDFALQWLHILRLRSRAVRQPILQAPRRRAAPA